MARSNPQKDSLKEPDKFLSFSHRLLQQMVAHRSALIIGACILLVLLAGVFTLRYFSAQTEKNAFALLQNVQAAYESQLQTGGAEKALAEVEPDLERLIDEYDETSAGRFGRVVYAKYARDAGDLDKSVASYQRALEDFKEEPFYRGQILLGLGHVYAAQDELPKAIASFERAAAGGEPALNAEALFNLGRLYEAQGDLTRSREAYAKLVADYPDSLYFPVAKEKV